MESGIHVKEVSCATIQRREPPHPHSSPATRRPSNQVVAGGVGKSAPSPLMIKQMKEDENTSAAAWNRTAGFQGVQSSSKLSQNFLHEEGTISSPSLLFLKELCITGFLNINVDYKLGHCHAVLT